MDKKRRGNPQVRVPPELVGLVQLLCNLHERDQLTQRLKDQIADAQSPREVKDLLSSSL